MPNIIMNKKEADTWPFYVLIFFSMLFAFVGVPALVIGFFDKKNFGLFIITTILVIPQMIGCWVCTWMVWREGKA